MDIVLVVVTVLVVVLVSMTLHELMHGLMAYYLGDDTPKHQGRLTLNPLRHIDPFLTIILPVMLAIIGAPIFGGAKPVQFNPQRVRYEEWGVALVALAGPLINFVLAFVTFGVAVVAGFETLVGNIMVQATMVNLGFFVFNMIPFPPLDGSRLLYAVAPDGVRRIMASIEQMGILIIFAIIMIASPFIGNFISTAMSAILQLFAAIFGVN